MYIEKLKLNNFRNYESQSIEFSNRINYIFGNNAQGKTNILESIYITSIGKSHRYAKDQEIINFGKSGFFIEIDLIKIKRRYKIEYGFDTDKGRIIKINDIPIKKLGDLPGNIISVLFSPDDLKIVKENPSYRRKFIDILICQIHKSYLYDLQEYYKILNQRNNLLKQIKENAELEKTLDVWDEKLGIVGSKIIERRILFLEKIRKASKEIHCKIASKEVLETKYHCNFIDEKDKFEEIKEKFINELRKNRKFDIRKGFTGIGPQRDDIDLFINDLEVEKYASQGQQRTVVLSLKLAELQIIKEETGETPILLLDDVFSELDIERKKVLIEYIQDMQVFITSTDKSDIFDYKDVKIFEVRNGVIECSFI
jgi:DNA replication and repair protein RecF